MVRIFGYGIGVIIVSAIWTVCVLLCMAFSRRKGLLDDFLLYFYRQSGFIYLVIAAVINGILYIWPKQSCEPPLTDTLAAKQEIDHLGIPRIIFAGFLLISALYTIVKFVSLTLFTPIRTKRVSEKYN